MTEIKTTRSFFFPTQVWTFKNPDTALNDQLRDRILELEQTESGVIKSNQGGWQSRENLIFDDAFAPLRQFFVNCVWTVLRENKYRDGLSLFLTNGWANVNRGANYNLTHTHGRSDWSMAYYFTKVSPEMGTIYFNDPVTARAINGAHGVFIDNPEIENQDSVEFAPNAGDLIVFPSWLPHGVKQNHSQQVRVTFSCNFTVNPASNS